MFNLKPVGTIRKSKFGCYVLFAYHTTFGIILNPFFFGTTDDNPTVTHRSLRRLTDYSGVRAVARSPRGWPVWHVNFVPLTTGCTVCTATVLLYPPTKTETGMVSLPLGLYHRLRLLYLSPPTRLSRRRSFPRAAPPVSSCGARSPLVFRTIHVHARRAAYNTTTTITVPRCREPWSGLRCIILRRWLRVRTPEPIVDECITPATVVP